VAHKALIGLTTLSERAPLHGHAFCCYFNDPTQEQSSEYI
jgi:hypothetical protein